MWLPYFTFISFMLCFPHGVPAMPPVHTKDLAARYPQEPPPDPVDIEVLPETEVQSRIALPTDAGVPAATEQPPDEGVPTGTAQPPATADEQPPEESVPSATEQPTATEDEQPTTTKEVPTVKVPHYVTCERLTIEFESLGLFQLSNDFEAFCRVVEEQGVQDENSGAITRKYHKDDEDRYEILLAVDWPPGHEDKPTYNGCMLAFTSLLGTCFRPGEDLAGGSNEVGIFNYRLEVKT